MQERMPDPRELTVGGSNARHFVRRGARHNCRDRLDGPGWTGPAWLSDFAGPAFRAGANVAVTPFAWTWLRANARAIRPMGGGTCQIGISGRPTDLVLHFSGPRAARRSGSGNRPCGSGLALVASPRSDFRSRPAACSFIALWRKVDYHRRCSDKRDTIAAWCSVSCKKSKLKVALKRQRSPTGLHRAGLLHCRKPSGPRISPGYWPTLHSRWRAYAKNCPRTCRSKRPSVGWTAITLAGPPNCPCVCRRRSPSNSSARPRQRTRPNSSPRPARRTRAVPQRGWEVALVPAAARRRLPARGVAAGRSGPAAQAAASRRRDLGH